ncbi:uncharacterized protein G2W53_009829 [Senna tora]|uniref:Uncharacterized protein n=1 Tax=Senna tora TaxID=362788 RepID=A0A834WZA3_9FABA|nr:uncharacterized protein G2W53_009829 [Senna tora]
MLRLESSWHGRSVDHVLTYLDDKSRSGLRNLNELRGKRLVTQVSQTRQFANRSGFDAPIGIVLAWEERGSCLNIFRTTNRRRISETFINYEAKGLLRKSVDHVLPYSGRQITVGSQKPSQITRQKTCFASESNTSVRVVFANRSGFDAPIGVVLAWEERSSCLNIFGTTNHDRISETFTNYKAKDLLRMSVDHVSTYFGREIAVGSLKTSRITRQKTCCASESNTSVRVVFGNGSGFDGPIGVVLSWEERGSCLNISRTTKRGRISETLTNYEAKDLLCNPLGMGGAWIISSRIPDEKSQSDLETFTNYEAKDLLRKSVHHVSTYFGRQITVGSQKASQITRQKTCCASESNTSVLVVFSKLSGFYAPFGVVLAWKKRGSYTNIFRMKNNGQISETFTNFEAKDLLRK